SISVAASVYESENRSTRNGSSAGSEPFAKSVPRCPAASAVIARLSIPARIDGQPSEARSDSIAPRMDVRAEERLSAADVVVVPVPEGGEPPAGADERVRALLASGEATAEFADITTVRADGTRLAIAGLGKRVDADTVRTAFAGAARETRRVGGT